MGQERVNLAAVMGLVVKMGDEAVTAADLLLSLADDPRVPHRRLKLIFV